MHKLRGRREAPPASFPGPRPSSWRFCCAEGARSRGAAPPKSHASSRRTAAPPTSWGREPDPAAGRGGTEPFLTPHRAAGPLAPPRCGPNAGGVRRWGGRAFVGFGRFLIPRTYTRELSGPRSRATWPRGRSWASAPRATRWNSGGRHVARSNVQTRGAHGRPGADGAPRGARAETRLEAAPGGLPHNARTSAPHGQGRCFGTVRAQRWAGVKAKCTDWVTDRHATKARSCEDTISC